MKGIVVCALGNDLILVLTCSLNGGKENKLVTNSFVKETRTIWHHLSLNLPKWEGAGRAWHPSLPEGKERFLKGAERSISGKNQNRDKAAVCCDVIKQSRHQPSGCARVWIGSNFQEGRKFRLGAALRLSPTLFLPLPFPQSSPEPGKESLGNIHTRLAVVCRDTDTMNAPFTLPLQTPLFKAKWCLLHLCGLDSVCTNLGVHTCIAHEADFGMFEVPFRKIPIQWTLIIYETSTKVKRQK